MSSNDNEIPLHNRVPIAAAHGQAALLLVESLVHGLCENGALEAEDAVGIAQRAEEVHADLVGEADADNVPAQDAKALLARIRLSLQSDLVK